MQDIQHSFHLAVKLSNGLWYVVFFSSLGHVAGKIPELGSNCHQTPSV